MSFLENPQRRRMVLSHCVQTAERVAIRYAVQALTGVVLSRGDRLAFGGHPAISALVAQVAKFLDKLREVTTYQSRWFEKLIPADAKKFWTFRWTPVVRNEVGASLAEVRRRILTKLKSRLYGVRADLCSRRQHANTSELQRLGSDLLYQSLFMDLS